MADATTSLKNSKPINGWSSRRKKKSLADCRSQSFRRLSSSENLGSPLARFIILRQRARHASAEECFLLPMVDLYRHFAIGKCRVESQSGDDRVPCFVLGNATSFDRTPKIDDFFVCHALENIPIVLFVAYRYRIGVHCIFLNFPNWL